MKLDKLERAIVIKNELKDLNRHKEVLKGCNTCVFQYSDINDIKYHQNTLSIPKNVNRDTFDGLHNLLLRNMEQREKELQQELKEL